ncbi:hypothetical protein PRIC1_004020 [Phytophthora ramorum]
MMRRKIALFVSMLSHTIATRLLRSRPYWSKIRSRKRMCSSAVILFSSRNDDRAKSRAPFRVTAKTVRECSQASVTPSNTRTNFSSFSSAAMVGSTTVTATFIRALSVFKHMLSYLIALRTVSSSTSAKATFL